METKQAVPDFLQVHVPEDGQVTFDDDTDNEGEEVNNGTNAPAGQNGSLWGELKSAQVGDAWGPAPAAVTTNTDWGVSATPSNDAWAAPPNTGAAPAAAW